MFDSLKAWLQTKVAAVVTWWNTPVVTTAPTAAPTTYSPPGFGLLALSSVPSLILGAFIDYSTGLLIMYLAGLGIHFPLLIKLLFALLYAVPKYMWSTKLGFGIHHVPLFSRGIVTLLDSKVPSGPDGKGLTPGYYWFPLGPPFYKLALVGSVKEMTVPFVNMEVWTVNDSGKGPGAVKGEVSGILQMQIVDLAEYKAAETPDTALDGYLRESARDVCEHMTMEKFIATKNEELAEEIRKKMISKLDTSNGGLPYRFGVRIKSITVNQTDLKNKAVEDAWATVSAQVATAAGRKTDADARVKRIEEYKKAGVDANRAAALDAVVSEHPGATISDQRYNVDAGQTIKDLTELLINKIPGGAR